MFTNLFKVFNFIWCFLGYAKVSRRKRETSIKVLAYIFGIGLVARILLVPTVPILEDDFNRYLWDGAVTANGFNPYK
ncbi:MAG: hypothetical protein GY936_14360 [Ignavibacteriae bacterium]|nr:hypothetical protein [Ignavibacteriota bacterium]